MKRGEYSLRCSAHHRQAGSLTLHPLVDSWPLPCSFLHHPALTRSLAAHAHILNKYPNRQAFIHLISTRSMALDIDPFHKFFKQNTLTTPSPQHDGQRIA
jgi:hypothetical protein